MKCKILHLPSATFLLINKNIQHSSHIFSEYEIESDRFNLSEKDRKDLSYFFPSKQEAKDILEECLDSEVPFCFYNVKKNYYKSIREHFEFIEVENEI